MDEKQEKNDNNVENQQEELEKTEEQEAVSENEDFPENEMEIGAGEKFLREVLMPLSLEHYKIEIERKDNIHTRVSYWVVIAIAICSGLFYQTDLSYYNLPNNSFPIFMYCLILPFAWCSLGGVFWFLFKVEFVTDTSSIATVKDFLVWYNEYKGVGNINQKFLDDFIDKTARSQVEMRRLCEKKFTNLKKPNKF